MTLRPSPAVLGAIVMLAAGCGFINVNAYRSDSAPRNSTGTPPAIDHLARGFLVTGAYEDDQYGYYAYLLFADQHPLTLPQRRAAAESFLSLFNDVRDVRRLELTPNRLALLLAPVKTSKDAAALVSHADVDKFLGAYDYTYASALHSHLVGPDRRIPRVALVGSTRPLKLSSVVDATTLRVIDLCGDAEGARRKLVAFQDQLLIPETESVSLVLLEKLRTVFESLGEFVLVGKVMAEGKPLPEGCM
jgi:hypothetical protein